MKEHLKTLRLCSSKPVEVIDTVNNNNTGYNSMVEAALAIGCTVNVISKAVQTLKNKGISRLINDRYHVTIKEFKNLEINKSSYSKKIEVIDTLSKIETTVYCSIRAAAKALGCSDTPLRNALKKLEEKREIKLVQDRYQVKPI